MAGLVPGYDKPGQQVDDDAELTVERGPRVRLARRREARARRSTRSASIPRASTPRRRRVHRRLHRRAAPARRRARDRGRRRLRPAPPAAAGRSARRRARADERARARPSCRSRRSSSSATSRSSRCGSRCRRAAARRAGLAGGRAREAAVRGRARATSARAASSAIPESARASLREIADGGARLGGERRRRRRLRAPRPEGQPGVLPPPRRSPTTRRSPMTSTNGSTQRSRPVSTAAVVTHGRVDVDDARSSACARSPSARASTLVDDPRDADLVVALGGDGTMLRTLAQLLGSDVPVIGVNFGRVGFLASIEPDDLERDLARVFAGEYVVVELPTLEVRARRRAPRRGERRRRDELDARPHGRARLGGRRRGSRHRPVRRDDLLDAVGLDRLQPLERRAGARARPRRDGGHVHRAALARTRGRSSCRAASTSTIRNATPDVAVAVLVDGHRVGEIAPGAEIGESTSASSAACSRRCPRRRSSGATARPSPRSRYA